VTVTLLRILPLGAALIVAGCTSTHRSPATAATTTTSSTSTTAPDTTTTAGGTSTTAIPTSGISTTVSAGGPLPAGFTVTDLTWVSDNQGWALGTAPCPHQPCTSVVHTLDGGRTWAGLPAPKAYLELPQNGPACSVTVACVQGIRFADASNGYAFGNSSLWTTTNGGHSWSLRSTDSTDVLEISHGTVVRITHPGDAGCPPDCPYQVQATTVGSATWHTLPSPAIPGTGVALAVEGTNIYEAAFGHRAGGAQDAHTQFARSTDSGAHWSTFSDPCTVTPSGDEADTTAISASTGGFLAVGCTPRVSGQAGFVVVSADEGATFGPHRGGLLPTVAPDGELVDHIAAATGQRLAVLVSYSAGMDVVVSNDAGAHWTVTHHEGAAPANTATDPTTGRAVITASTVLTTTDGGGHWTPFTFP
jgi:photosystem II stability/assembly factor-like uncharacterized protein